MVTIAIQAEESLLATLEQIAERRQTTIEEVTKEALHQYLQRQAPEVKTYSFIGIGHSGKKNLSTQVDSILAQAAKRDEGWSLPK
jgi:metal-responsive CopG/Arc/MetJ family transcriptional regulator